MLSKRAQSLQAYMHTRSSSCPALVTLANMTCNHSRPLIFSCVMMSLCRQQQAQQVYCHRQELWHRCQQHLLPREL
jgi:hypothetical protein